MCVAPHTVAQGHWRSTCGHILGKNPTNVPSAAEDSLSRQTGSEKSSNKGFDISSQCKQQNIKKNELKKIVRKSNKNILGFSWLSGFHEKQVYFVEIDT